VHELRDARRRKMTCNEPAPNDIHTKRKTPILFYYVILLELGRAEDELKILFSKG